MNVPPINEMRCDPWTGRRVFIAEGRSGRPNDFADVVDPASHADVHGVVENCPFCRGNEHHTPQSLITVCDDEGDWHIRVVPNKYPAVTSLDADLAAAVTEGRITGERVFAASRQPAAGIHEVIIEAPLHVGEVTQLSVERFTEVLRVYRDRITHWLADERVHSTTVFKNSGCRAGASLEHLHSQLLALPFIPEMLEQELQNCADYHSRQGRCLGCDLLEAELAGGERLVTEVGPFVASTAIAGRQPYEMWIASREHQSCFTQVSNAELAALATILQEMVCRLGSLLNPLAYNLMLHTAPVGDPRREAFHWHWELVPRSTSQAGFEWGTGTYINPLAPERAARMLREIA